MPNKTKEIYVALAKKVSQLDIPTELIEKTVSRLAENKEMIRDINVCTHGICLDYFIQSDKPWGSIENIVATNTGIKQLRIFPWGIPNPDIFHVEVELDVPELKQYMK